MAAKESEESASETSSSRRRSSAKERRLDEQAAIGRLRVDVPAIQAAEQWQRTFDALPEDHPDHDLVGLIEREIDRIAHIVQQMYKLHSRGEQTTTDIPVEETIRNVLLMLEPLGREREVAIGLALASPKLTVKATLNTEV